MQRFCLSSGQKLFLGGVENLNYTEIYETMWTYACMQHIRCANKVKPKKSHKMYECFPVARLFIFSICEKFVETDLN